jgi:hypothetical protein
MTKRNVLEADTTILKKVNKKYLGNLIFQSVFSLLVSILSYLLVNRSKIYN